MSRCANLIQNSNDLGTEESDAHLDKIPRSRKCVAMPKSNATKLINFNMFRGNNQRDTMCFDDSRLVKIKLP